MNEAKKKYWRKLWLKALALECPDRIFISFLCTLKKQLGKIFATTNEKSKNEGWQSFLFFNLYDNKQNAFNVILFSYQKFLIEMKSIVLLLSNSQGAQLNSYIYIFLRYWYPSFHTLKREIFFLRQLIYRLNWFLVKSSFLLRYFANDLYFFVSSSTSSYNLSTFIERRNKF